MPKDRCCCEMENCPDAIPFFPCGQCSICLQALFLANILFMAAMMLPTSLIVLFNILCACDSLERNFEKDYKANRFTPELNQNLIDQTNGDKKDPEKPSVAYDDNDDPLHINQTQKPQFVDPTPNPNLMYYPPPEMPSNNKPDEDNPYNQDNPYS